MKLSKAQEKVVKEFGEALEPHLSAPKMRIVFEKLFEAYLSKHKKGIKKMVIEEHAKMQIRILEQLKK